MMLRFVTGRLVNPDIVAGVHIAGTDRTDFAGSTARESVEAHHIGHDGGKMRDGSINDIIGNRLHGGRLPRIGPTRSEANDRLECLKVRWRDQLFADGPLEKPFDFADTVVDLVAADSVADKPLLDRLQRQRTKVAGRCVSIEFFHRSQRIADVDNLLGRLPILAIVLLGKLASIAPALQ